MKPKPSRTQSRTQRRAFSINEAAAALGVSHWSVRRMIKSGALRSCRVLRTHLIPISEVERLLKIED